MDQNQAFTEENLRRNLLEESWFPNNALSNYLATQPPDAVNNLLARVAEDADREHPTFWTYVFAVFWLILTFDAFIDLPSGRKFKRRMAGIRAALYLAQRNDLRAIVPLACSWDARPLSKSEYQEQIEQSLIRLLSQTVSKESRTLLLASCTELAERVWRSRQRWRDIRPGQADLLVAIIRQLASPGGEATSTLHRLQEGGSGVNRARVREAARLASTGNF